jgi:hypothetical protein
MLVRTWRRVLPLAGVLLLCTSAVARATVVAPMSLERVTREASRIVRATVADVRSGRDATGLPATWVTIETITTVKGGAGGRMVIKQYGVAAPLIDGTATIIAGLRRYRVGEELVLFLRADSRLGFTSPVGLGQGVYEITYAGTRPRVTAALSADAAVDLDKFLSKIARLVAGR